MESVLDVNFLVIIVSGAVAFALGALWYSPFLFGKQWQALTGNAETGTQGMGAAYAVTFVSLVLLAWAMAILMVQGGIVGLDGGLKMGALVFVFIIAPLTLTQTLYGKRSMKLYVIDAGYHLVVALLIGLFLGLWP